jgi:uncharacterized membrane protein YozB (DUF420 family)
MIAIFGTEAGFFVDLFLLVQLVLLPTVGVAILMIRRGKLRAHVATMVASYALFLLSVVAFEAEVHFGKGTPKLPPTTLVIHLCFAVPCLVLWTYQMWTGKRALTAPKNHRLRGRILFALLTLTVATGVWLYKATW